VIISLLCVGIQGRLVKKNQCPNSCGCPQTYKPVCGESGRTHGNLCLANCAGDKLISEGACNYKCKKIVTEKLVKVCRNKVFGKNSMRKQCCSWIKHSNGKKTNKKCEWIGETVTFKRKSHCKWVIKRRNVKQRQCCKWTEKTIGRFTKKTKKHCKFVGKELRKKNY